MKNFGCSNFFSNFNFLVVLCLCVFLVWEVNIYFFRGSKKLRHFYGFVGGDGVVIYFFLLNHLSLLREVAYFAWMFATLMEFWSDVCDFPGDKLQHFVEQYDWYGEFHHGHPFVNAQWCHLENGG